MTYGGRIHLVKNVHVDKKNQQEVFRRMFSPQIEIFEAIKREYDLYLLLQNPSSDTLYQFTPRIKNGRKRR